MGQPPLLNRVLQSLHDVILTQDIVKDLWPIFARKNLITHEGKLKVKGERLKVKGERWVLEQLGRARVPHDLTILAKVLTLTPKGELDRCARRFGAARRWVELTGSFVKIIELFGSLALPS